MFDNFAAIDIVKSPIFDRFCLGVIFGNDGYTEFFGADTAIRAHFQSDGVAPTHCLPEMWNIAESASNIQETSGWIGFQCKD